MIMDETELIYGEVFYERRIVSFFDTLGWREQVLEAGDDPRRIARLASVPRTFASTVLSIANRIPNAHITAFSDNVIVSIPYQADRLEWSLEGLATIQLALAFRGFWVRGATTIGELFHDSNAVFGPALGRVYELESRHAIYPRTLLDPEISELMELRNDFIDSDDSWRFTDPFTVGFIERVQRNNPIDPAMLARFNEVSGAAIPTAPLNLPSRLLLHATFVRIRAELISARRLNVWQKHAWLFDRIAPRVHSDERSINFPPPTDNA